MSEALRADDVPFLPEWVEAARTKAVPKLGVVSVQEAVGVVSDDTLEHDDVWADLDAEGAAADLVRVYLNSMGRGKKSEVLTIEEEVELGQRIEAGLYAAHKLQAAEMLPPEDRRELSVIAHEGAQAKERFIVENLRLVVSVAKKYTGRGMPFLDLIQEGNLGLIRAVEKYDYTKNNKFSTYAVLWIQQYIQRSMGEQSLAIRLPDNVFVQTRQLRRLERNFVGKHGWEPDDTDLAGEMDISAKQISVLRGYTRAHTSLDKPIGENDSELIDIVQEDAGSVEDEVVATALLPADINTVVATLDQDEQVVIRLKYGLDDGRERSIAEISRVTDIKYRRAKKLVASADAKLREPERVELLRHYME